MKSGEKQESGKLTKKVAVPGETIVTGPAYLPGFGTRREGGDIVATRFGLIEIVDKLVKIIPLSGVYLPKKGNTVIGKVSEITLNGWFLDIASPYAAFLPVSEVKAYIRKGEDLATYFTYNDILLVKIVSTVGRVVTVSMKERGMRKLTGGLIEQINPNKVPRVIGKRGSMLALLRRETGCSFHVGHNGLIWISGSPGGELVARRAIQLIAEKSFIEGLTDRVKDFLSAHRSEVKG